MKNPSIIVAALLYIAVSASAQQKSVVTLHPSEAQRVIPKEIYGQFSEHLGACIYGGLWVGEDSDIPNVKGYRTDVFNALKELHVPVLRWPGGCFADEYHWMEGIGSKANRKRIVNNNWGGVVEDNSFGTHEFLNLCEMLGCEPYISGNVGSGTVEELAKWIEYMTADGNSTMANLRRQNGRDKPWKVKYVGIGNESWGCGGNMRPEYYSDLFRRYANFCRNYNGNQLFKVASGASDYDYNWTDVLMKNVGGRMDGLSLHYYTVWDWNHKGRATKFSDDNYYYTLGKCSEIDGVLKKHCTIMDKYDPKKHISLMLDEWGTWWDEEPGTILLQQNTMRDAFVAALSLNIFHRYTDRLKMANIAQVVNVLQSMILTKGRTMVLTPTYYVFRMYRPHQDATFIPLDVTCDSVKIDKYTLPLISATASKDRAGTVHISLANISLKDAQEVTVNLSEIRAAKVTGEILTSTAINDCNTFDKPDLVKPEPFEGAKLSKNILKVKLPAKSIVALELVTSRN